MTDNESTPGARADERISEMKEDPELQELEQLYTNTGLPRSERTPERLAQEIRARAERKAAENLESSSFVRLAPRKPPRLQIVSGFSLAAGVLLGILLPFEALHRNDHDTNNQITPPVFMGQEELKEEISGLKEKYDIVPSLASVLVEGDPASKSYAGRQQKSAAKVGVDYQLHELPNDISEQELVDFISDEGDMTEDEILTTLKQLCLKLPEMRPKFVIWYPCYYFIFNSRSAPQYKSSL